MSGDMTELLREFGRHADACDGCDTSRTLGTWQAYRCAVGKRIGKQVIALMSKPAPQGAQTGTGRLTP